MNSTALLNKISDFPRWHYEFDLNGIKTPIFDPAIINRHKQRKVYLFEPLVDLFGGSLAGKRILDLGCNAGFWSLCAIEHGCQYVLGIDGRQMHVDQANLVFEVKEVTKNRYEFQCANFFDLDYEKLGKFDIVLCLGIFYHISKHINLLEVISKINTDVLLIDTSLSTQWGSILEIHKDNLDEPRDSVDYELVMWPTHNAVLDMVKQMSYEAMTLEPNFTDYEGADDYKSGSRRAFICSKTSDLTSLSDYSERNAASLSSRARFDQVPGKVLFKALLNKIAKRIGLP